MKLLDIRDILLTVGVPVSRYSAHKKPDKYIVWAEEGQSGANHADDRMTVQTIQGTIDYFTKTEDDPNFQLIQKKLNSSDLVWRLNSIQREEDTKYFHYEWVWEVDINLGEDVG